MDLYQRCQNWLRKKSEEAGGPEKLAERLGIPRSTFYKAVPKKPSTKPVRTNVVDFMGWLEKLGAKVVFPEEHVQEAAPIGNCFSEASAPYACDTDNKSQPSIDTTRDVCWVTPEVVSAENGPPPATEDYFAVPLAEERVAAGKGLIPSNHIKGWVLVWRHEEAIRFKRNLVAVQIGPKEHSMVPTLYPGDIVLVNRDDKDPSPAGKLMLVVEPGGPGDPGGAMIKRVSTKKDDGDIELVYYSDNAKEYAPFIFKLNRDYGGDITRAIAGRVIWAWANMTKR